MGVRKNNKIIYIISVIVIIIGAICTCTMGLKYNLKYDEAVRINIYIGKEYNMEDIKQIAQEVFGNEAIMYQEIEMFQDTAAITLKYATDEQVTTFGDKIREKYEPETEQIVEKIDIPHQRLKDTLKPYITPIAITSAIIVVAIIIMAYIAKANIITKLLNIIINLILAEGVYLSVFAIARLPIGEMFIVGALSIYILVVTCSFKVKLPEKNKDKKKK